MFDARGLYFWLAFYFVSFYGQHLFCQPVTPRQRAITLVQSLSVPAPPPEGISAEVFIRQPISEQLLSLMDRYGVLNQYQTGSSLAFQRIGTRFKTERALIDQPGLEFSYLLMPKYGYLNIRGKSENLTEPYNYGEMILVMKDTVFPRTTFHVGDSLYSRHAAVPITDLNRLAHTIDENPSFFEAEIWGPLDLGDVSEISVPESQSANVTLLRQLKGLNKKYGLEVSLYTVEGAFRQSSPVRRRALYSRRKNLLEVRAEFASTSVRRLLQLAKSAQDVELPVVISLLANSGSALALQEIKKLSRSTSPKIRQAVVIALASQGDLRALRLANEVGIEDPALISQLNSFLTQLLEASPKNPDRNEDNQPEASKTLSELQKLSEAWENPYANTDTLEAFFSSVLSLPNDDRNLLLSSLQHHERKEICDWAVVESLQRNVPVDWNYFTEMAKHFHISRRSSAARALALGEPVRHLSTLVKLISRSTKIDQRSILLDVAQALRYTHLAIPYQISRFYLQSHDSLVTEALVDTLTLRDQESDAGLLIELLEAVEPSDLKIKIIRALKRKGDLISSDVFIKHLKAADDELFLAALDALVHINDEGLSNHLKDFLVDLPPARRQIVIEALASLDHHKKASARGILRKSVRKLSSCSLY